MATITAPKGAKARVARSPKQGIVRAIVAVTGVEDQVNDIITPGVFAASLAKRWPKVVFHHSFQDFAGRVLTAEEWMPGDPRLPKTQPNGDPWPVQAGALVVTMQFNLATQRGREVFEWARFYAESGESAWSIGYTVPPGMGAKRGTVRHIHGIDVFEVSLVLHGANALTSALEVKSTPHTGQLEAKQTPTGLIRTAAMAVIEAKGAPTPGRVTVAGLAVKATDTGRVLLLQRGLDDEDPASGKWEFPGGHLDKGEDPLAGAVREWQEETGASLPTGQVAGSWDAPNGIYRGFVYVVPTERSVKVNAGPDGRHRVNPDDPDGDAPETVAWFDPTSLPEMPALRDEARTTPWSVLASARVVETKGDRSPVGSPGDRENWVDQVGGLPLYIREIAHALIRAGHPEQHAIRLAVGAVQRWASGGDDVHADTRAKAAAAVAEWEAKKAAAHADNVIERKSAAQAVAEAKALTAQEAKAMHDHKVSGSLEETLTAVRDAVRGKYAKADGGCYARIEATFPDAVIYTVFTEGGPHSYRAGYTAGKDGVSLADPAEVKLELVAVDAGEPTQYKPADAVEQGVADAFAEAAAALAAAPMEAKHLNAITPAAANLLDALSAKGMDTAALVFGDDYDPDLTGEADQPPPDLDVDADGHAIAAGPQEAPEEELEDDVEVKQGGTWGGYTGDPEGDDDVDEDDSEAPALTDADPGDPEDGDDMVTVDAAEIAAELDELRTP